MSDEATIRLPDRFDYAYQRQFGEIYLPYLDNPTIKKVILDFSQVGYLDSSALGMMILLHKKFSSQGKALKIKGARGTTRDVLNMANMQNIFEFI